MNTEDGAKLYDVCPHVSDSVRLLIQRGAGGHPQSAGVGGRGAHPQRARGGGQGGTRRELGQPQAGQPGLLGQ